MLGVSACKNKEKQLEENPISDPQEISKVTGIARIEPENGLLYIYAHSSGTIVNMPHSENDMVQKGDLLIGLDEKEDAAQLALEQSKISNHLASINAAKGNLMTINVDLEKAKADEKLNIELYAAKAITLQTLNDSKAKTQKLTTQYNLQLAEIEKVKSQRKEIDANIHHKKVLLAAKSIRATRNGKILEWDVSPGDYTTTGQKLGLFAPEGALIAVTEVDELFADKVQIGLKADVISQLDGQKIGEGEVVFVADFLKKKSLFSDENVVEDRRVRTIKIRLTPDSKAIINARVDCVINLK